MKSSSIKSNQKRAILCVVVLLLAGCSGGDSPNVAVPSESDTPTAVKVETAQIPLPSEDGIITAIDYSSKETASRVILYNPTIEDISRINQQGSRGAILYLNPAKSTTALLNNLDLKDYSVEACEAKAYETENCGDDVYSGFSNLDFKNANISCTGILQPAIPNVTHITGGRGKYSGQELNFIDFQMQFKADRLALIISDTTALEWELKFDSPNVKVTGAEISQGLIDAGTIADNPLLNSITDNPNETAVAVVTMCPKKLEAGRFYSIRIWFKWKNKPIDWQPNCPDTDKADGCENWFSFDLIPSRRCSTLKGVVDQYAPIHPWNSNSVWNCKDMAGRIIGNARVSPPTMPARFDQSKATQSRTLNVWSPDYAVSVTSPDVSTISFDNHRTPLCGDNVCDEHKALENHRNCPSDCPDTVPPPSTAPATSSSCTGQLSGWYCGTQLPGYAGQATDIVRCQAGTIAETNACPLGCRVNPPGTHDECVGNENANKSCAGGNGLYCGESDKGQNTKHLYQCIDGSYSLASSCSDGCQKNALGKSDACVTSLPSGQSCTNGNGLYCGDPTRGQTVGNLYQCLYGAYTLKTTCSNGCQDNGAGVDDSCKSPSAPTPTCPHGDGLYCGNSSIPGQNASYLYRCSGGSYSLYNACSNGCQDNGAGVDDSCKSPPAPTPTCPYGDGLYCGSSSIGGQNTGYLYRCSGGSYSLSSACSNGCQNNGAGVDDSCKSPPAPTPTCPSGNGLYCGNSVGLSSDVLYKCKDGKYSEEKKCSSGCQVNPSGTDDSCKGATSCPSGTGYYCGGPVGLSSNSLYYCKDGEYTKKKSCSNGCRVNPPGTDDACK